jgi:hypothetical protein
MKHTLLSAVMLRLVARAPKSSSMGCRPTAAVFAGFCSKSEDVVTQSLRRVALALLCCGACSAWGQTPAADIEKTPAVSDAARIAGTFAGALLGFSVPLVPLAFTTDTCFAPGCLSTPASVVSIVSPFVGVGAAAGAHRALGGRGGIGAALLGASAGGGAVLLHQLLWTLALSRQYNSQQLVPIVATNLVFASLLSTFGLELRHRLLTDFESLEVPWQRFALESLPMVLGVPLSVLLLAALVQPLGLWALVPMLLVQTVAIAVTGVIHQAMGGKGTVLESFRGALILIGVGVVASIIGALQISASNSAGSSVAAISTGPTIGALAVMAAAGLLAPAYSLEFGHQAALIRQLSVPFDLSPRRRSRSF